MYRQHRYTPWGATVSLCTLAFLSLGLANDGCVAERPDELGPYAVGRQIFAVVDQSRDNRALPVDVWYPATATADAAPSVYDLLFTQLPSTVALDNPPLAQDEGGPFPMVVFSHGLNSGRFQSIFLMEQLASHGFIVVAPDHVGNTAVDLLLPQPPPFEMRDRPLDISFTIDSMLARASNEGDIFFAAIDPDRIGVMGHSLGAFTALAMKSGFEDVAADPRVSVVVPISPAAGLLSDGQLATIDVPALVLGGTSDITTPIDPNSVRVFANMSGVPRWRVDIERAGHASFTDVCLFFDALSASGAPPEVIAILAGNVDQACVPDLIDLGEAQRISNFYAVSFLQAHLAGRPEFLQFLTPGAVTRERLPVDFFFDSGH